MPLHQKISPTENFDLLGPMSLFVADASDMLESRLDYLPKERKRQLMCPSHPDMARGAVSDFGTVKIGARVYCLSCAYLMLRSRDGLELEHQPGTICRVGKHHQHLPYVCAGCVQAASRGE